MSHVPIPTGKPAKAYFSLGNVLYNAIASVMCGSRSIAEEAQSSARQGLSLRSSAPRSCFRAVGAYIRSHAFALKLRDARGVTSLTSGTST